MSQSHAGKKISITQRAKAISLPVDVLYGGTGSDLSATGPGLVAQPTLGGALTVSAPTSPLALTAGVLSLAGLSGLGSSGDMLRSTGSAWEYRSPAQVLSDIGAAASAHTHLLAAGATDVTATAAELNILDGATLTVTELNYVDGVTSAIQTQLDAKQPLDATLTALAGLATGADKLAYSTGTDTFAQTDLSSFARSLLDDANAAAGRDTLGASSGVWGLAVGGTAADLSGTGGTGQFLRQSSAGAAITVSVIGHADLGSGGGSGTKYLRDDMSWQVLTSDHGALTGLGDDDHSIYALLAGRSGGQTIIGGTGASENLTLTPTSHATKGWIDCNGILKFTTTATANPSENYIRAYTGDIMYYNADGTGTHQWLINGSGPFLTIQASAGAARVGIGLAATIAARTLEVRSTSAQIRCSYDSTYYWEIFCDTGDHLKITHPARSNNAGDILIGSGVTGLGGSSLPAIAIGNSSSATAVNTIALGRAANANTGNGNISIGATATSTGAPAGSIAIGSAASANCVNFAGVAIGATAVIGPSSVRAGGVAIGAASQVDATHAIAIGSAAQATGTGGIAIGSTQAAVGSGTVAPANTCCIGSPGGAINDVFFGKGVTTHATPTGVTLNGTGGSGTDIAGGALNIAGGKGTGTGAPGVVNIQVATTGTSGTTLQTLTTRFTIGEGYASCTGPIGVGGVIPAAAAWTTTNYPRGLELPVGGYTIRWPVTSSVSWGMTAGSGQLQFLASSANDNSAAAVDVLRMETGAWTTDGWGKSILMRAANVIRWPISGGVTWGIGAASGILRFLTSTAEDGSAAAAVQGYWTTSGLMLGTGSAAARMLEVRSTSAQVRGSYDATTYWEIGCDLNGNLSITGGGTASNGINIGRGSGTPGASSTIVGTSAAAAGASSCAFGRLASAAGGAAIAIGLSASTGANNGAICIGETSSNTGGNSVAIGRGATAAANQFVSGNPTYFISNVFFGSGALASTPVAYTLNGSGGSGTDIAGGALNIAGGKGTGNALGGSVKIQTSTAGASGATLQTLATVAEFGAATVGLYGVTPVVRAAAYTQTYATAARTVPAVLTDSTTGTPGTTLADVTATPSQTIINDNFASLNARLNTAMQLINSLIDDSQGIGIAA